MNSMGNGLGLFISKQIVESCGGEIGAHSEGPDLGSVFSFNMQMEHLDEIEEAKESKQYS